MSTRLKEANHPNYLRLRHDANGNYSEQNGIRRYTATYPVTDGMTPVSTAPPRGSELRTSHATGRDYIFILGNDGKWQVIGNAQDSAFGKVAATGSYSFLRNPVADDARTFNSVAFTYKLSPVGAVQVQLPTGVDDPVNDTILGTALFNLAAKLNASVDASITPATYSTNATNGHKNGTQLIVTHDTEGAAGNAYTLGSGTDSLATRSAATLTGGSDAAPNPVGDPASLPALAAPDNADLVIVWDVSANGGAGGWAKTTWTQLRSSINV